jgi:hypothetical protein
VAADLVGFALERDVGGVVVSIGAFRDRSVERRRRGDVVGLPDDVVAPDEAAERLVELADARRRSYEA